MGQVDVQRRDRDLPLVHGPQVGPRRMVVLGPAKAHPVVVAAAQVGAFDRMHLADVAEALAGHLDFLDQGRRQGREVEVHHHPVLPALGQQARDDRRGEGLGRLPVRPHLVVEALQRLAQGDRADAEGHALQRPRHRARIGAVLADIVPAIDPRQHQIGPFGHQVVDRQHDAVGRRPGHGEAPVRYAVDPQRLGQGDAPPLARLLDRGRADPDVVRQRPGDPLQTRQPLGLDAVVIGQKNAHAARALAAPRPVAQPPCVSWPAGCRRPGSLMRRRSRCGCPSPRVRSVRRPPGSTAGSSP